MVASVAYHQLDVKRTRFFLQDTGFAGATYLDFPEY